MNFDFRKNDVLFYLYSNIFALFSGLKQYALALGFRAYVWHIYAQYQASSCFFELAVPQINISSNILKYPKHISLSSRQQFRIHGDSTSDSGLAMGNSFKMYWRNSIKKLGGRPKFAKRTKIVQKCNVLR
ncbi:MAG: hypothetical protein ACJA11_003507 [Glaciecola sp.]|jgi:hypothetical protein